MKNNRGVSLLELSIVIAVIGLLLAAIVEGFSIRRSSEVRSFLTDISTYQNAIEGFYSKYTALPGDMPDAYTYWTTDCATVDTDCNGDNDGRIEVGKGDTTSNIYENTVTSGTDIESYRAWQHLLLSDFLGGGYTGTATTSTKQADIGINIPASKRAKVGYSIYYNNDAVVSTASTGFSADMTTGEGARNEINLGGFLAGDLNLNSALTPAEALAVDMKLDDGIPATGIVHGIDGSDATVGACFTGSGSSSVYTIATTTVACRMTFPAKL